MNSNAIAEVKFLAELDEVLGSIFWNRFDVVSGHAHEMTETERDGKFLQVLRSIRLRRTELEHEVQKFEAQQAATPFVSTSDLAISAQYDALFGRPTVEEAAYEQWVASREYDEHEAYVESLATVEPVHATAYREVA